jgi:fumarate reductase subunit C
VFRTYRAKMITAALIMAVLLQAFFLISGLINVKQVYSETENNLDNKYYQYLQDTVSTIFNDIYTLASILRTDRFLEYAEANWNLKDKNEADKIKERINHDINNLQLNPAEFW